tara:strand:+ start:1467 stop:1622 length:156 start_codon:yes stop_codon:yes gene_type:complete
MPLVHKGKKTLHRFVHLFMANKFYFVHCIVKKENIHKFAPQNLSGFKVYQK